MTSRFDACPGLRSDPPEPGDGSGRRGQTTVDRAGNITPDAGHELRLLLDPVPDAARAARGALWEWESAFDLDDAVRQDTLVVVSELVTNAILHARSVIELIATIDEEGLRLEVHDLVTDPPILAPRSDHTHGFGLRLVADLTDRWGWRPTSTGKYVWAETSCHVRRPAKLRDAVGT